MNDIRKICIVGGIARDYESCLECVHSEDSVEICILRRCTHAIGALTECFAKREQFGNSEQLPEVGASKTEKPKQPENGFDTCMNGKKAHDKTTGDLISRAAALKLAYTYLGSSGEAIDAVEVADIEDLQGVTRWTPVSRRLPDLDEDGFSRKVLVCFSNFSGCEICEYRETEEEHGWYVGDSDDQPDSLGAHVIAWMPLPEPYIEEKRENHEID